MYEGNSNKNAKKNPKTCNFKKGRVLIKSGEKTYDNQMLVRPKIKDGHIGIPLNFSRI